tara:strand:- start:959 stop:1219 length:261 start_codon:yes stop_codon:yes gene_type:complete
MPLPLNYVPESGDLLFWSEADFGEAVFNLLVDIDVRLTKVKQVPGSPFWITINEKKEIEKLRFFKQDSELWELIAKGSSAKSKLQS